MKFEPYIPRHLTACLRLFDLNCPAFFAPNERSDYETFLKGPNKDYRVGIRKGKVVAAFGFQVHKRTGRGRISWIMVSPEGKGKGVGSVMMAWVRQTARLQDASVVEIAASHLSAPFFSKFGAMETTRIPHGWGPGMHRVNMEWAV